MSGEILHCPWCNGDVIIEQINCGIFRHGLTNDGNQLPPHMNEQGCVENLQPNSGCGKPFRFDNNVLVKCGFDT